MNRLPHRESRWVWEIEKDRARMLVEVQTVVFNGEEWWVRSISLPEAPVPILGPLTHPADYFIPLDRFWEAVTPVGGRIEDLSNEISEEQKGGKVAQEDDHV